MAEFNTEDFWRRYMDKLYPYKSPELSGKIGWDMAQERIEFLEKALESATDEMKRVKE